MKKFAFLLLSVLILSAFTTQMIWKADKTHTELNFSIVHMGISEVSGCFKDFEANIETSKADFSDAVITMTAQINSIDTRFAKRDEHLMAEGFFDVAKHPTMTFKSTAVKKKGKNKFKVTGDLTLKGVTKSIELDLVKVGQIEHPRSKKQLAAFKISGEINRTDFGVGQAGGSVSEIVKIMAQGEFIQG